MNAIFHEYIGRFMEVYIDDVMVKSILVNQHIDHLRKAFVTMRKKGLKMNPLKCDFGVSARNFLGFVVHKKGIAIDKSKADAIVALSALKSKKEFEWTNEHQQAFDSIKAYLSKASITENVRPHESLKLYIAASVNTIGCMLAQDDEKGNERAVYYLSRVLTDIETRIYNEIANELAQISSRYKVGPETLRKLASIHQILVPADEREALCIDEWEDDDWRKPIAEYLKNPSILVNSNVKLRAINFVLMVDELYKKGIDGSLGREDKNIALGEVHKKICGAHQAGKKMKWELYRNHVYWLTMIKDCIEYAKACQECQKIPQTLSTDQGTMFTGQQIKNFTALRNINMVTSTPYYAQANGQVEAANKILIDLIKKQIGNRPQTWHETLSQVLWAYRNSPRGSTGTSPYKLVYGHDAVLPLEINMNTLRVSKQNNLSVDDYWNAMFDELNELDSE
nr:uncharacterized protein LOC112803701 [Arachis hypogaea]